MIAEQRKTARKILKTKALFALEGAETLGGRTLDIGTDGVAVAFSDPVPSGKSGFVRFDLMLDGKPNTITVRSKVVYCIFGQGHFKVGFQFQNLDAAGTSAITRFLR